MPIELNNVWKSLGAPPLDIVRDVSLTIDDGDSVAITGRSGSGKSTLLYMIATLDVPTRGSIAFDGRDITTWTDAELHAVRNRQIGFVFQTYHLFPELTVMENILLPARKAGELAIRQARATTLLETVGLAGKAQRLPRQLSGGEQQRVAIARALVMDPRYLFADEPTGNLDSVTGDAVMDLLRAANRERGMTLIMVTHDQDFAATLQRQIHLVDGQAV